MRVYSLTHAVDKVTCVAPMYCGGQDPTQELLTRYTAF